MKRLIKNGLVFDGSGTPGCKMDILTEDEYIIDMAPSLSAEGAEVIDAAGKIVTPAFVDIHRHMDAKLLSDKTAEIELKQGIATTVVGNCGFSLAPDGGEFAVEKRANDIPILGTYPEELNLSFPKYLEALEKRVPELNAAAMIGLGAVRINLKGFGAGELSSSQLEKGRAMIGEALSAGAAGVSAGIMYLPEFYTKAEEYDALLAPLKGGKKPFVTHIRGEGDSMVASVKEVIDIAARAQCPLEISHFKSCGMKNWGKDIYRAMEMIENARNKGQDITVDFYPYIGGSTALTTMLPPAFIMGDMPKALLRLGTKEGVEEFRKCSLIDYSDWDNYAVTLGWDRILISSAEGDNKKFIGMTVTEAAEKFGFEDDAALAAHLMHTENGRTAIINLSMDQKDVDAVARLPYSNLISDSIYADTDNPHPRLYGAFPRFIREYVYERKVVNLETAIMKMTSQPAKRMQIKNRGEIKKGNFADILIFDENTFRSDASFNAPTHMGQGIDTLTVNGEVRVKNDIVVGDSCGKVLRIK